MDEWNEKTWQLIAESADRTGRLQAMSNRELSDALLRIWQDIPLMTEIADTIDEAIDRLSVWDEDPAAIRARIDARNAAMLTDEDRAAMKRGYERALETIEAKREEPRR